MADCIDCHCEYIGSATTVTDTPQKVSDEVEVKFTPESSLGTNNNKLDVSINISSKARVSLKRANLILPNKERISIPVKNNIASYTGELANSEHRIEYAYEGTPLEDGTIQTQVTANGKQIKLDTQRVRAKISSKVDVDIDDNACEQLQKINEEKVKDTAIVLKYTQPCYLAEEVSKGFYGIWCVLQNIILTLCYVLDKVKSLKPFDDTEIKNRLNILESKEDKDTIYNDSELRKKISSLENKPEKTFDDSELKRRITTLENKQDKDTVYTAGSNISINGNVISATIPAPKDVDLSGYVPKADYDKVKGALDKIIANLEKSGAWSGGLSGGFKDNRNIATGNINLFGGTPDGNSFIRTNSGSTENDLAGGI